MCSNLGHTILLFIEYAKTFLEMKGLQKTKTKIKSWYVKKEKKIKVRDDEARSLENALALLYFL